MVHFVGAGSGAADLITLRGKRLLETQARLLIPNFLNTHALIVRYTTAHL